MLLEDQALLIGAIGLFAALSAIMLVTRRIDWYAIGPARRGRRPIPRRKRIFIYSR
jgi:inner membrane protein